MENAQITAKINGLIRKYGTAYFVVAGGNLYHVPDHHKYINPASDGPRVLITKVKAREGFRYYYEPIRKFQ